MGTRRSTNTRPGDKRPNPPSAPPDQRMKLLGLALLGLGAVASADDKADKNYQAMLDRFNKFGESDFTASEWSLFKIAHRFRSKCVFPGDEGYEFDYKPELITWSAGKNKALSQKEIEAIISGVGTANKAKYEKSALTEAKIINLAELAKKYGDKKVQEKFDKIKVIQKIKEEKAAK